MDTDIPQQNGSHSPPSSVTESSTVIVAVARPAAPRRDTWARRTFAPAERRAVVGPALLKTWFEGVLTSLPLVTADILALAAGIGMGRLVVAIWGGNHAAGLAQLLGCAALAIPIHLFTALYPGTALAPEAELRRGVFGISAAHGWVLLWLAWLGNANAVDLLAFGVGLGSSVVCFALFRPAMRSMAAKLSWWGQSAIILSPGTRGAAESLVAALRDNPEHGLIPVGIVEEDANTTLHHLASWSVKVVDSRDHRGPDLFTGSLVTPHQLIVHPMWASESEDWKPILRTMGLPGLRVTNKLLTLRARVTKRIMDIALSSILLLLLSPLLLVVALLNRAGSDGPVFFSHKRIGRDRRPFRALKFRSMQPNAQERLHQYLKENPAAAREWAETQKLTYDPRITPIGRFIRNTSLDELPQLWNVLVGDMSLVGPRPIIESEVPRYGDLFLAYLQVRPGITGLWQVSGRNDTTYPQRVELDAFYVRNWTPWLDLLILFRTFRVVVLQEGAR